MDYSKIDWTKLPELPGGMVFELRDGVPTVSNLRRFKPSAKKDGEQGYWQYLDNAREELVTALAATNIIDRFIAEQEAELSKPKPRLVTPNQLLVELIQTGNPIRVGLVETKLSVEYRWEDAGRLLHRNESNDRWQEYPVSCLFQFEAYEVEDPPKPRLPIKTQAPEGHTWETDRHGNVVLREIGTDNTWGLVDRSVWELHRKGSVRNLAIVNASEELNPAT